MHCPDNFPSRYGTVIHFIASPLTSSDSSLKFLFNNLVKVPSCLPGPPPATAPTRIIDEEADESEALLSSSILDETAALPADLGQGGFDVVPENQHHQRRHSHSQGV